MNAPSPGRDDSSADPRDRFDALLEEVLSALPAELHRRLEEVPLVVEDAPTPQDLRRVRVRHRDALCGLYTGIPLTHRSVEHSGTLPDVIRIFRRGILAAAADAQGRVTDRALRRQIRLTVLHEIGHHFGLGEADLRRYGYG
ncbi:MAG: metallopeptidase family protein [Phycisphaerae bacterium]|nr:metallopeptidase family protein [Phycisphaerae bacterium]